MAISESIFHHNIDNTPQVIDLDELLIPESMISSLTKDQLVEQVKIIQQEAKILHENNKKLMVKAEEGLKMLLSREMILSVFYYVFMQFIQSAIISMAYIQLLNDGFIQHEVKKYNKTMLKQAIKWIKKSFHEDENGTCVCGIPHRAIHYFHHGHRNIQQMLVQRNDTHDIPSSQWHHIVDRLNGRLTRHTTTVTPTQHEHHEPIFVNDSIDSSNDEKSSKNSNNVKSSNDLLVFSVESSENSNDSWENDDHFEDTVYEQEVDDGEIECLAQMMVREAEEDSNGEDDKVENEENLERNDRFSNSSLIYSKRYLI